MVKKMGGRNSAALLKALFFHAADKTAYPLVFALEDILRGTLLQNYAAFHKEYTVGDIPCKAHFMGHYEQGHGMILGKAPDDRKHFINKFRVERGCRLVKEHAPRFDGHGPGNGNTLLLAPFGAGEGIAVDFGINGVLGVNTFQPPIAVLLQQIGQKQISIRHGVDPAHNDLLGNCGKGFICSLVDLAVGVKGCNKLVHGAAFHIGPGLNIFVIALYHQAVGAEEIGLREIILFFTGGSNAYLLGSGIDLADLQIAESSGYVFLYELYFIACPFSYLKPHADVKTGPFFCGFIINGETEIVSGGGDTNNLFLIFLVILIFLVLFIILIFAFVRASGCKGEKGGQGKK